jgi:two-component system chemotaxis sensor kinase CheA
MDLSAYTELFLAEAREHLAAMNRILLHLEREPGDRSAVDELFRAVHTLKGTSAAMGYGGVSRMAHALEHTLEGVRDGRTSVDSALVDTMLAATDSLDQELERQAAGGMPPHAHSSTARPGAGPGDGAGHRVVRAYVTIARDTVFPAVRALLVLRAAREMGEVSGVEPPEERISSGDSGHELSLLIDTSLSESEIAARLTSAGEVERVEIATTSSAAHPGAGDAAGPMVRVAQARLDTLVDYVGEMVFARNRLRRVADPDAGSELEAVIDEMSALVERVRDEVMRLRRVPASEALDRLPRAVRDTARALGKEIEFELVGRDTQLDRSVLRESVDLLIHLLRNAVDHGIESPEEREAAGKPRTGRVRLSAELDRAAAVLRVEDDGRGLQRDEICRIAIERGLITEDEAGGLPDGAVLRLITQPGFSTTAEVSDVSGRGVGLDVVRSRVESLGGSMELRSEPGVGTTFALRFPLTLSIVRVLHVLGNGDTYALPVTAVMEIGEVEEESVTLRDGREITQLRDEPLPLIRLPALLTPDAEIVQTSPTPMVVISANGRTFGLLIDGLEGQGEAVTKRFDAPIGTVPIFAGATLLDDGRPALILDAERLAPHADSLHARLTFDF